MRTLIKTLIALSFILAAFMIGQTIEGKKIKLQLKTKKQTIDSLTNVIINCSEDLDSISTITPDTVYIEIRNNKQDLKTKQKKMQKTKEKKKVPVGNNR